MDKISPELAKLMADKFRELARVDPVDTGTYFAKNWVDVAAKIVEKLPKPIDPDLIEARGVAASQGDAKGYSQEWVYAVRAGKHDNIDEVIYCLAGVKHGRALAGGSA